MRVSRSVRWAVAAAGLTAGQTVLVSLVQAQAGTVAASAPAAAPAPTVCGTTPNCAESNDFAAMITNFRTSELRGYKMLDVVVRFRNKTANPLVLGYLQNSGTALDEKGNRYSVFGGNGVRGIGQVAGNSFDPKFTLPPGGIGDAQFELAWYPGQQIYGFTFMLDLTIDEINSYEGNQHSLGGEFPLHFEGLTNGVSGGNALAAGAPVPGAVPGALPCNTQGAAGTAMAVAGATGSGVVQNAAGQAGSTVATAASTVSGITSLFKHKKSQPAAAAPGADPCASAAPAATVQAAPTGAVMTAAPAAAGKSPGPVTATTTSTGAIAAKNPVATNVRPGPTAVKSNPVITATSATGASAAKPQPIAATPAAKAPTPTTTTAAKPVTAVKTVATGAPAKKDSTAHPAKP